MRALTVLALAAALALAACGGDDDAADATTATTEATAATTAAPSTTAPRATTATTAAAVDTTDAVSTAPAGSAPAGSYVAGADPDADAAALVWTTVFDSTTGYDAKAALIADAEALRPTIDAYTPAGQAVGGIALVPTTVTVDGDTATIVYAVTFAGQPAYEGQTGTVQRVGGAWQVSREEFCAFMAAARNPCAG